MKSYQVSTTPPREKKYLVFQKEDSAIQAIGIDFNYSGPVAAIPLRTMGDLDDESVQIKVKAELESLGKIAEGGGIVGN